MPIVVDCTIIYVCISYAYLCYLCNLCAVYLVSCSRGHYHVRLLYCVSIMQKMESTKPELKIEIPFFYSLGMHTTKKLSLEK